MSLVRGITRKSAVILVPLALVLSFFAEGRLPAGVIFGGLLGLLNIKGLAWGVEGLIGSRRPTGRMVFFSMSRLLILFIALVALLYLRIANILGILIGFSVVFAMVIVEGLRHAKRPADIPAQKD